MSEVTRRAALVLLSAGAGLGLNKLLRPHTFNEVTSGQSFRRGITLLEPLARSDNSPGNIALARIPDSMPGALSFDRYYVRGAQKAIVHIRQTHTPPRAFEDFMGPKDMNFTRQSQNNIYYLVLYLLEQDLMQKVLSEGAGPGDMDFWNQKVVRKVRGTQNKTGLLSNINPWFGEKYAHGFMDLLQDDAITRLLLEERIEVDFVDDMEALIQEIALFREMRRLIDKLETGLKFSDIWRFREIWNEFYYLNETREDRMIENIHDFGDVLSFLVLGSSHKLAKNIADWNAVHPDYKFSLGEIATTVEQ